MNCKNCGAPHPSDGGSFCSYCGTKVEEQIKRRVVRGSMNTYRNLVNVELVGNMNTVVRATNCLIRGNMNTVTGADADTVVSGNMNTVRRS